MTVENTLCVCVCVLDDMIYLYIERDKEKEQICIRVCVHNKRRKRRVNSESKIHRASADSNCKLYQDGVVNENQNVGGRF